MINEFDYENLQKTFKNSEPFSHCIIDNFFDTIKQTKDNDPYLYKILSNIKLVIRIL